MEKVCETPHDAGGSLDLRSESVSRLRLVITLVSLFVLVPFAFWHMLALARLALPHKPPDSVISSPLTLGPSLGGGNAVTHLRSKTLSVYLVEPWLAYSWLDRSGGASLGPRYLLVDIHELHYFARGRKEVGGANLPILDYLVMEKK